MPVPSREQIESEAIIESLMDEVIPHRVTHRRSPRLRPRAVWWRPETWAPPMSEISEKTRVGLTVGGAALLLMSVFGVGQFWGDWRATNRARDITIARHEEEIKQLRSMFTEMQGTLREIKTAQDTSRESTNTAVRNTTFMLEKMGQVQVALAERGIIVRGN